MVVVFVVVEAFDLVFKLLGAAGGQDFESEAVRQSDLLLESIEATVHDY